MFFSSANFHGSSEKNMSSYLKANDEDEKSEDFWLQLWWDNFNSLLSGISKKSLSLLQLTQHL